MKRKFFGYFIALMFISLVGIIAVQLLWIKNAINVKEEQFDRTVYEALKLTVIKIEKENVKKYIDQKIDSTNWAESENSEEFNQASQNSKKDRTINYTPESTQLLHPIDPKQEIDFFENELSTAMSQFDSILGFESIDPIYHHFNQEFRKHKKLVNALNNKEKERKANENKATASRHAKKKKQKSNQMQLPIAQYMEQLISEYQNQNHPPEKRLNLENLYMTLFNELKNGGVLQPFEFGVIDTKKKKLLPYRSANFKYEMIDSLYRVNLFPNDVLQKKYELVVQFPYKTSFITYSLEALVAASIFFTLVIFITFTYAFYVMVRQKQVSEIKSDFINNMTHEFKTPIATIQLAADAISNPKIIDNKDKILHFSKIIKEENRRMNNQVENVLQMALLDNRDFKLRLVKTDINRLVRKAVENTSLQVEKRGGRIECFTLAEESDFMVDELHFTNVIYNLLDNAMKYSTDAPEITIETENLKDGIKISVEDKGIGMSREVKKRIFEKFYRAHTGNVHNIKGFGLGLSYVKAIVDACNGQIRVMSEEGQGSKFEILLWNTDKPKIKRSNMSAEGESDGS